jgi:hypothetical protein
MGMSFSNLPSTQGEKFEVLFNSTVYVRISGAPAISILPLRLA